MEKTVRILEQSPLATRTYTDRRTGEERVMNNVSLKLTDGLDTFLGEITGERAVSLQRLDPSQLYRVQCTMAVRNWTSQKGEQMQATTIYIDKISIA